MNPIVIPLTERQEESVGVKWRAKSWLTKQGTTVRAASRLCGISDTTIHIWDQHGVAPLSFWKACMVAYGPKTFKRADCPDVIPVSSAFRVTPPMVEAAHRFDTTFKGIVPLSTFIDPPSRGPKRSRKPRSDYMEKFQATRPLRKIPESVPAPTPAPTASVAPTPGPTPERATPAVGQPEVDVLLALLVQITSQRNQLAQRCYILETRPSQEDALRGRITELERELQFYKELAEQATAPSVTPTLPPKLEPKAVESVTALLTKHAPSLANELASLPSSVAASRV